MWNLQLFKLNYDHQEIDAVTDVLNSGWLTMGEKTASFEYKFASFLGLNSNCAAVANGTAALHMALLASDVGLNDEVIIPSLTFVADANVVKAVGATPILADCSSLDDWNMSLQAISKVFTVKTKALIVVHYAGYPCSEIDAIAAFCKEKGVTLIEDVAHAPGASYMNRKCGTWGDIACFSFFSNKNLSIGEGGMVVSQDKTIIQKLKYIRSHGMTTLTLDRHKGRAITYDVAQIGLNYRIDEMRAAIGIVQLSKLHANNSMRRKLTSRYRFNFNGTPIQVPFSNQDDKVKSACHILPVLLPVDCDRISVIEYLKAAGIQSSIHYPPFWDFTAYKGQFSPKDVPITADICQRQLTLPLFPSMTEEDVNFVTNTLLESLA